MFLGEFEHSMDEKGRVVLPRPFRDELAEGCVVTKGSEGCLYVFPEDQFKQEMAEIQKRPRTRRDNRRLTRILSAAASNRPLDRQGRVLLTDDQRRYAELGPNVVVVGANDRVEIWSKDRWAAETAEAEAFYFDMDEEFTDAI